jgi:hypothetical protein
MRVDEATKRWQVHRITDFQQYKKNWENVFIYKMLEKRNVVTLIPHRRVLTLCKCVKWDTGIAVETKAYTF